MPGIAELGWNEASQQGHQPSTGSEQGGQVRVHLDLSSVDSEDREGKEGKEGKEASEMCARFKEGNLGMGREEIVEEEEEKKDEEGREGERGKEEGYRND
ncbi:hypothetical protein BZA77DRAFT_350986 [Pyronema omphalodes]|nr:hypothetical protein BZA77DRAFT_363155 [Pyronema omphalodes]KAI5818886.1 hypothetical protein BZA77DRAFT_350986 [Pyronema omphalodes]